ncbi:pyridoxamine 5'-phosphate oxidase-domain-containing protein [Pelagophyceae sp. CCMP2097]|nr:pyridoxamine 5'-phosphate oxidase-domain-containing protein [Pelagophyceae sp. CCMP2097]|mmetsp:Transcript_13444/g.46811  ORF Transcript_13444/g.46811 Transcript_13444/m.46811 type:complete len:249 (-) Transcript_13444:48-794(-)
MRVVSFVWSSLGAASALRRTSLRFSKVAMSALDGVPGVVPWAKRIEGSIAKSRKVRGGNYVQIATVDANGAPKCRTVVFRGFAPDGRMKMITDKRSHKVQESAAVELCWWFSKSSEQYRIAGSLEYVGADHGDAAALSLRKQQWGNLSENAREQFFWVNPPRAPYAGAPYDGSGEAPDDDGPPPAPPRASEAPPAGGRDADGVLLDAPDAFLLVLLQPQSCDYLRLTDNFRQMDTRADDVWAAERVNP